MTESKAIQSTLIFQRRDISALVAAIHNVSASYVRKVRNGDRESEGIMSTYMSIVEQDRLLLEAMNRQIQPL